MAYTVADAIGAIRVSRRFLLRHLEEMREDQWDWRPGPPCKSARETLAHLVCDDRALLASIEAGAAPDLDAIREEERDAGRLRAMLNDLHERVVAAIRSRCVTPDDELFVWSRRTTLGAAASVISSEDYYHAGQLAVIRMATDPAWDFVYYDEVYG